ncbi:MAG TPA: SGNH/GDSL hydrolase family protein, partial [Acetobacteraceae bacterium]|nr:SGNH/GDSL hydrolase family protein [Acetobacteraceae bacterium]
MTVRLALAAMVAVGVPGVQAGESCPANPPQLPLHLPHLRAALAHGEEAVIVALGSSSTSGAMATSSARSYPAELQAALAAALPDNHVAVLNRGIGGQDAPREVGRIEADVIAVRPQLVIWQVGANAALRAADPLAFRHLVGVGIRRMQASGIDVVLMDNQRSPRILATREDVEFDNALADLAATTGAGLFSRDRLMRRWEEDGAPSATFIATDGLHHNDLGYLCVARALA